jgi:tRNA threonylcarbamoyladenosine modification (KEOPS) complex  Pcc1 subunit
MAGLKVKAEATIRLRLSSEKQLTALLEALTPEAKEHASLRTKAVLEREGNTVILRVEAKDTVALRAALNAYLRWIGSTIKVIEMVKQVS